MLATAVIHSVAGEKRLIGPLLSRSDAIPTRQGKKVLRSAWHLTSLFMLSNALAVIWPANDSGFKLLLGSFWLATGLFSLVSSRGKHVGWPTLSAAGITALIGAA